MKMGTMMILKSLFGFIAAAYQACWSVAIVFSTKFIAMIKFALMKLWTPDLDLGP